MSRLLLILLPLIYISGNGSLLAMEIYINLNRQAETKEIATLKSAIYAAFYLHKDHLVLVSNDPIFTARFSTHGVFTHAEMQDTSKNFFEKSKLSFLERETLELKFNEQRFTYLCVFDHKTPK